MGDRCCMRIHFRKQDAALVAEAFDFGTAEELLDVVDDHDSCLSVKFEEINYGGQDELEMFARLGGVLYGCHSGGGSYPAERFCVVDGRVYMWSQCDGSDIIEIDCNSQVDPDMVAAHRLFCSRYCNAESLVNAASQRTGDLPPDV